MRVSAISRLFFKSGKIVTSLLGYEYKRSIMTVGQSFPLAYEKFRLCLLLSSWFTFFRCPRTFLSFYSTFYDLNKE